jgi:hypothetical protein
MNKIKNIVFTFIALVLFQSVALAQDGAGDFGGDPGDNPLDTPIDSFVWVLLVVGLVYVFYKYSSLKSKEDRVS